MADLALLVSKPTKSDIILISVVLTISILSIIFLFFFKFDNASGFEIRVDGQLHSSYSFSDLKDGDIIEIKTQYGYNKFLYENQSVRCIETNCKDRLEIKSGTISKTNQVLVCLPHKLTVHIIGNKQIDAVSY